VGIFCFGFRLRKGEEEEEEETRLKRISIERYLRGF
jgi:hypothetical protein